MEEPLTTYTVKGRNFPSVWIFKYDLEGNLKEWKLEEGVLSEKQRAWLFHPSRFPYLENAIKTHFMSIRNLEVTVGVPDLSFEYFWKLYENKKGKKLMAERSWNKLSKSDRINALAGIKHYNNSLRRSGGIAKAYPATYINQRYWENDHKSS